MGKFLYRLKKTVSRKHDYIKMHDEYDKVCKWLKSADKKQWETAKRLAQSWCIKTGYKEGLDFLGLWPWRWIALLSGSFTYHQNFIESYNFWVDELQMIIDEKDPKYQDSQSKIGFAVR